MSDCYFGLDIEKNFKYNVGPKVKKADHDKEDNEEIEGESWIQKLTKNLLQQEEEEVSDDES